MGKPSATGMCMQILKWALIWGPFIFLGDFFLIVMSIISLAVVLLLYSGNDYQHDRIYLPAFICSMFLLVLLIIILVAIIQVSWIDLEEIAVKRRTPFRGATL